MYYMGLFNHWLAKQGYFDGEGVAEVDAVKDADRDHGVAVLVLVAVDRDQVKIAQRVEALMKHEAYDGTNPNRVRAVVSMFAMANPTAFHALDGSGYDFIAAQVRSPTFPDLP